MKASKSIGKRGQNNRKRNPIVLYAVEGDNKTERIYLQNYQRRNGPRIISTTGNRTDPVKMMAKLVKEAKAMGLSVRYGDKAFCIFDTDTQIAKQLQIDEACKQETDLVKVISSSPCIEEWFLCHLRWSTKYQTSAEANAELKNELPEYKKNCNIYPLIKDRQDEAIKNAKQLELFHIGLGRNIHSVESNPSSEMYKVVEFLTK